MNRFFKKIMLAGVMIFQATLSNATDFFPMTLVDPGRNSAQNTTGMASNLAIWSYTPKYLSPGAGSAFSIHFPTAFTVPAFDPSTCDCLSARFTTNTTGSFGNDEVLITSGSVTGNTVNFNFPQAIYPGNFYVRFDPSAGILNPLTAGAATLTVTDPNGVTTSSRHFSINPIVSTGSENGTLSGKVLSSTTGKPVPSALVYATNSNLLHPAIFGPTSAAVDAYSTTMNSFSHATNFDGAYTMTVPYGNYAVSAAISYYDGGSLLTATATASSATLSASNLKATVNFSLPVN